MDEYNLNYSTNPIINNSGENQQDLPNSVAVLILGIVSIATCWCWGIVGIICGGIALFLASQAVALYNQNPAAYKESSFKLVSAGKICAIIGLILSVLYLVYIIIMLMNGGAELFNSNIFKY